MKVVVLFSLILCEALAQPSVAPILDCVSVQSDHNYLIANFGYVNVGSQTVTVATGSSNFFSPAPPSRGQPTTFLPGVHHSVFQVTVDMNTSDSATWSLEGSTATATNDPSAYCSMAAEPAGPVGPMGTQGAPGPQGSVGPQGTTGIAGPAGIMGATGVQGMIGNQGLQGLPGDMGSAGQMGSSGIQGPPGLPGSTGPVGPVGPQGPTGAQGPVGLQGSTGARGPAGFTGSGGLQGPIGLQGPQGAAGVLPSIRIVSAVSVQGAVATASCSTSEVLLGGGASCSPSGALLQSSFPNGSSWTASCSLGQTTSAAVCAGAIAGPVNQSISFGNPGNQLFGTSFALSALASSGLPVTFTSLTPATCTVTNAQATFIAAGPCTIQVTQTGNATYAAARPVIQTFTPFFDVSSQVSVTQNGFGRNRSTGIWSATVTVTNTSAMTINGPIEVALANLSPNATIVNMSGLVGMVPYVVLSTGPLAPGASANVVIQFTNPSSAYIGYTPITYSGAL